MGCNNSKGPRPDSRGPKLQPPAARSATPAQSLIRVKLVLLGATGVGKSCLVVRYVKGLFESASRVTVGAAFLAHSVALPDGRTVKFEIWDTAGQERYASLAPLYYRGAGAAVVMYDITSAETFTKAKYWVTELQKNAPGNLVIVLAGNKSDLAEHRQVTTEEGQAYAASNSMIFLETSAKTAANVAQVFDVIAKSLAGAGSSSSAPGVPPQQNRPAGNAAQNAPKPQGKSPSQQSRPASSPAQNPNQGTSKAQGKSPAKGGASPRQTSPGSASPGTSTSAAASAAAAGKPESTKQSPQLQQKSSQAASQSDSAENPPANPSETLSQSTASIGSDSTNEPLPPSKDATILEPPKGGKKRSSTTASVKDSGKDTGVSSSTQATTSQSQKPQNNDAPQLGKKDASEKTAASSNAEPAEKVESTSKPSSALNDNQDTEEDAQDETGEDLPSAPRKAEPRPAADDLSSATPSSKEDVKSGQTGSRGVDVDKGTKDDPKT